MAPRSAEMSNVRSASRCTPPMPPVANTAIPARAPGLEQDRGRVPRALHELVARAVGDARLDHFVAEAHFLLLDVHAHRVLRRALDRLLQPLEIRLRDRETRDAEHRAVAEEDL